MGLSFLTMGLLACGGEKNDKKEEQKQGQLKPKPGSEKVELTAFDKAQMEGNWEVIDASGYSRDKMMGQTYSFVGDSATIYQNWGDGGMGTGFCLITPELVTIEFRTDQPDGSSTVLTAEYKGGFNGKDELHLNGNSEKIKLKRK